MDNFKHNAKNKELANSLMSSVPHEKRIHRTFGGFVGGLGSIGLPMIGEMMGGPLGGVAGNILGMASQQIGNQMDGRSANDSPYQGPAEITYHGARPRSGTMNIDATRRGNEISALEGQTGAKAREYHVPANGSTFDDDAVAHQQNEISRLQTIGQNNEMRQELESLRNQLGMRPNGY